jgi:hypothetical protein
MKLSYKVTEFAEMIDKVINGYNKVCTFRSVFIFFLGGVTTETNDHTLRQEAFYFKKIYSMTQN